MDKAPDVAKSMLNQGYTADEISNAFSENGFNQEQVATILKKARVSVEDAYTALNNTWPDATGKTITDVMIKVGYNQTAVYDLYIADTNSETQEDILRRNTQANPI